MLMLQLEVPTEVSLAAGKAARASAKVSILEPGPVRPFPEELIELADVITPNETAAEALVGFPVDGREAAERAVEEPLRRGAKTTVIQLGAQGAVFATGSQRGESAFPVRLMGSQTAFPVEAVDTVAAGMRSTGRWPSASSKGWNWNARSA